MPSTDFARALQKEIVMKSSRILAIIVVLQALILLGQWSGQPALRSAQADTTLPNPGERQIAILDELKTLNGKVDRLIGILQGGDLQVKVAKDDQKKK
jgi:hypothetical protein